MLIFFAINGHKVNSGWRIIKVRQSWGPSVEHVTDFTLQSRKNICGTSFYLHNMRYPRRVDARVKHRGFGVDMQGKGGPFPYKVDNWVSSLRVDACVNRRGVGINRQGKGRPFPYWELPWLARLVQCKLLNIFSALHAAWMEKTCEPDWQ